MAQYDGSIRINAEIDTKGFKDGEKEIESESRRLAKTVSNSTQEAEKEVERLGQTFSDTAIKIAELRTKMELLKNQKIPTEEYTKAQKEVDKYSDSLQKAKEKIDKLLEIGVDTKSSRFVSAQYDVAQLENKLLDAEEVVKRLKQEGKAFTLGADSKQFTKYEEQLQKLKEQEAEEQRLNQIRENAVVANEQIIAKIERIKQLEQEIADLKSVERTEGYADYDNRIAELSKLKQDVKEYSNSLSEVPERFSQMRSAAQKAFDAINSGLSKIGSIGKKAFSGIFSMAKKAFSAITRGSKQSNASLSGNFKTILKYGFGIRSLYALFNKIRSGIQQGFKNLMDYSGDFANSIQSVKNSMSTLGNQIAAAFAPIVQMVIPWLNQLINALSTAMNYVAQFIAALTGKGTFTKAKQVQDAYNKSLGGTAAAAKKAYGALAKFDDLDVLQKKEDDTGAGDAAGTMGDLFEEVPISDKFKDIVQWLKDMWENSDFYELGKLLGEKLKEALDSIPWDEIKEIARKIGKSIATFINGFIEVEGLGESIGLTLAEAFNTGFEFLNAFVHELHWDSLGQFIAETINGFFANIDWNLIYDTFITGAEGLGDAINSFVDYLDWETISKAISSFFNTFIDTVYTFITTIDWKEVGEKVGKAISDAWTGIDWKKTGETVGEAFKAFFDFIATAIENVDWWAVGESVKDFLVGIDWAGVADSFFEAVGAAIGGLAAFLGGLIAEGVVSAGEYFEDKIEEAGGNVVEGILVGIAEALVNIGEWIKEHIFKPFMDGFKEAFGIHSPSTVMAEMGGYLIEGLINGIKDMWNSLKDTISEIGEGVITKFKDILGIHSPSKETKELGKYTIEGYINGLESNASHISDIWTLIKEQTISILQSLADWISNFGLNISDSFVTTLQNIQDQFTQAWTTLYKSTVETWTKIQEYFTEFWTLFIEYLIETWEEILLIFTENFEQIQLLFEEFITFLNDIFLVSWLETWILAGQQYQAFSDLLTNLTKSIQDMLTLFMKQIENLINTIWKNSWKNAGNIFTEFKGRVQEISGAVREIVQSLFDFVMSLVAEMLAAIASVGSAAASISGGGGFSAVGGSAPAMASYSTQGFATITADLPHLASGSVIRGGNPFMAILGDQRAGQTNIEAPAGLIKDMARQGIREELAALNFGSGSGQTRLVLSINGTDVGEAILDDLFSVMQRRGYDVDVLGVT